jgi:hypothetical protein
MHLHLYRNINTKRFAGIERLPWAGTLLIWAGPIFILKHRHVVR